MLMNLEQIMDLREQSFSSPDFQVGVRNNPDRGKPGGKKCLQTRDMLAVLALVSCP